MSAYSYNFNENVSDPSPASGDSHGTACAGEIVMARDNNVCGVGVAYDASMAGKGNYTLSIHCLLIITGLRLLGGATTDSIDASALGHSRNNIDIYSNSWGPADNSVTVDGPKYLTSLALKEGAEMVYSIRNECCNELIIHYREGMAEGTFLHLLLEMEEGFYLTLVQLMVIPRVYMLYQLVLMLRMVPLLLMMRNVQLNRL